MQFKTRKLVSPPDLNPGNTLFGGQLLRWIDEEVAIYAMVKLGTNHVVTKYISEINFINPAYQGDIIEIGAEVVSLGRTSITLRCEVRIKDTDTIIISIDKFVMVHVDMNGRPKPHHKTMEMIADNH
jgi:acyl-CoA hydrolase